MQSSAVTKGTGEVTTYMLSRLVHILRALALLLAVFFAHAANPAHAQNNAALVIDHSGSMWAQAAGTAKITAVRDALTSLFDEYDGKLNLGMLAFGTGKSSNACEDFEVLKPLGALNAADYTKALSTTKPKGSSPLSAALLLATKFFGGKPGAQPIIIITDGPDDCRADPCATARNLKQKTPEAVVHVVAFDAQAGEKLQELSCVAEATGGVFATAKDAGELEEALRKVFEASASGTTGRAAGPSGAGFNALPGGIGTPGGAPATSKEPGTLELSAILSAGTPPLNTGMVWRIYDGRAQDDGSYKLLQNRRDARPSLTVPPGDYLINGSYGLAQITKRVTVWPGKRQEDTFNLNAGGLRLYATLAKQPLLSEQSLTFDISSEETDQSGNRRKMISNAKPGIVVRLNSGNYRVQSTYGDGNSVVEADVAVEPGKLTEATLDHQAGKITFKLVQKQGGEALADTVWTIFTARGGLVKRSGGAFPTHILAAGNYQVKAEYNGQEYAMNFTVVAGDKKSVEVVMQ